MERDNLFTNLPPEIIANILSRLPHRAISISKCVCKPWLRLLDSDDFVRSHLSTSAPAMAVIMAESTPPFFSCTLLQFTDDELDYAMLAHFGLGDDPAEIEGAANGLLLLSTGEAPCEVAHHVCNPITRQYAEVPPFLGEESSPDPKSVVCYGFGVSRVTGEYKVVRVYQGPVVSADGGGRSTTPEPECHVHTLGTGAWRRVGPGETPFQLPANCACVFLNGSLHWLVKDAEGGPRIWCFDLETEQFSSFPAPPVGFERLELVPGLSAVKGCLYLHDVDEGAVVWAKKEGWVKENVTNIDASTLDLRAFEPRVCPIDVCRYRCVLLVGEDLDRVFYCYGGIGMDDEVEFFPDDFINGILLKPSFVSLRGLGMENVVLLEGRF